MNQVSSGFFYDYEAGKLNTTGSNFANIMLYAMTLAGTFLAEHWYLVIMIVFGGIHAYAAIRKHKREEREFQYKQKDRELLLARDEERVRLERENRLAAREREDERLKMDEFEKKRNRDASNTRADLYCEKPEKRRTSLMTINGGKNE